MIPLGKEAFAETPNDYKAVEVFMEAMAVAFVPAEGMRITFFGYDLHNLPPNAIQTLSDTLGVEKLSKSLAKMIKSCRPDEWRDLRGNELGYERDMPMYSM